MTFKEKEAFRMYNRRRQKAGKEPVSYEGYLSLRDRTSSRKAFATRMKRLSEKVRKECGGDMKARVAWKKYNHRRVARGLEAVAFETWRTRNKKRGPSPLRGKKYDTGLQSPVSAIVAKILSKVSIEHERAQSRIPGGGANDS